MAKKSMILKQQAEPKFSSRRYNRCKLCGRPHAYLRNYGLGIKEQLIFPEIEYDKIEKIRGLDVVICTTAKTDEEAKELLSLIGAPFAR